MEVKICEINFSTAKELVDKNVFVKTNTTNIFLFGDNPIEYPAMSDGESLTYYISPDYICIPALNINIHALRCACYDMIDPCADDYAYIIVNSNCHDDYFHLICCSLDSLLASYIKDKAIKCNDISSLQCDLILISTD